MKPVGTLLLLADAATWSGVAYAQAAGGQSDGPVAVQASDPREIVVTPQRREQSILSVPIAITAVTGNMPASRGVTNSASLASVVPSLQINSAKCNVRLRCPSAQSARNHAKLQTPLNHPVFPVLAESTLPTLNEHAS